MLHRIYLGFVRCHGLICFFLSNQSIRLYNCGVAEPSLTIQVKLIYYQFFFHLYYKSQLEIGKVNL